MADIVGIGCACFDIMMIVDEYPVEDTKCGSKESKTQCGGPCAVACIAAAKQDIPTKFYIKVGDDAYGNSLKNYLDSYGVDTSDVTIVPGGTTGFCVVISNRSNSKRTCIGGGYRGGVDLTLKPEDINLDDLKNAKYLHVDGMNYEAALYAAKKMHEFGGKVCMDAGGYNPKSDELFNEIDILIPSETCTYQAGESDDFETAAVNMHNKFKPEVLVCTAGPRGGIIVENGEVSWFQAFPVEAIDSNGAGDVFHGGFLAALCRGMNYKEAAEFASATSAIKCTHFGASEGAPHYEDVVKFLKERKGC